MMAFNPPLILVEDWQQAIRPVTDIIEDYWQAGGHWVWLRTKDMDEKRRRSLLDKLAVNKRRIILSNYLDLVVEYDLAGIHLSQSPDVLNSAKTAHSQLKTDQILGVSVHNEPELHIAEMANANYIIAAPVFPTASKPGYGPTFGTAGLKQLAVQTKTPVVALAGISPENARICLDSDAQAVAVMGEFMRQNDTKHLTEKLLKEISLNAN